MQQKWALILTRTQQRSNQFSQMTSLVRHKCALSICTKQSVSQPTLFLHFFRSSTRQHQTWVNKQHYVLLISPRKKWTRIWHSLIQMIYEVCYDSWIDLFFFACLSVPHTFRGTTGPSQLSMARQKEPCHSDTCEKWRWEDAEKSTTSGS